MKNKLDYNLLIAIGVLISSFAALFVYIRQAAIMNKQTEILLEQTKANAWPNLSINVSRSFGDDGIYKFVWGVQNRGTGPAIIEASTVKVNGKPVKNWTRFYKAINIPDTIPGNHSNASLLDEIIAPNSQFSWINWNSNPTLMRYVFENADKVEIEICYRSVFNDRWKVKRIGMKSNLEQNVREEVELCDIERENIFLE